MANIFRVGGSSGAKKNYIFKDGVFSIQPTNNNFTVSNGKLVNGSFLRIPFVGGGKRIIFDVTYQSSSRIVGVSYHYSGGTLTLNSDTRLENAFPYVLDANTNLRLLIGVNGDTHISFAGTDTGKPYITINEIWVENLSGE